MARKQDKQDKPRIPADWRLDELAAWVEEELANSDQPFTGEPHDDQLVDELNGGARAKKSSCQKALENQFGKDESHRLLDAYLGQQLSGQDVIAVGAFLRWNDENRGRTPHHVMPGFDYFERTRRYHDAAERGLSALLDQDLGAFAPEYWSNGPDADRAAARLDRDMKRRRNPQRSQRPEKYGEEEFFANAGSRRSGDAVPDGAADGASARVPGQSPVDQAPVEIPQSGDPVADLVYQVTYGDQYATVARQVPIADGGVTVDHNRRAITVMYGAPVLSVTAEAIEVAIAEEVDKQYVRYEVTVTPKR